MRRPRGEDQHRPVGFSDETFPSTRRWMVAALAAAATLAAGIGAVVGLRA